MRIKLTNIIFLFFTFVSITYSQTDINEPAVNQLKDRVVSGNQADLDSFIAPYVTMAKNTLPEAIDRFTDGLSEGYKFFVITRIYDDNNNYEQIFVFVDSIENKRIYGKIASDIKSIPGYKKGDAIGLGIDEIFDWTIVEPDGTEEGNYIGKMLDVFHERIIALIMEMEINPRGEVTEARFIKALSRSNQNVTFCVSREIIEEACNKALGLKYEAEGIGKTSYTYLVYDFVEKRFKDPSQ